MKDLRAFVIDASVAAKWILTDEEDTDHALRVLTDFSNNRIRLHAPEQMIAEVASTLAVASSPSRARLSRKSGRDGLARFLALTIETTPSRELVSDAFDFAEQFSCSLYDALYLVLARRQAISFLNADRKLHERVGHLPEVIWVADYVSVTGPKDD
jgi:predicted nucleic acid-binding protein